MLVHTGSSSPNAPSAFNSIDLCDPCQLIPQIVINYRRHSTTGLQPTMMLLWALAGVPLGVYNIVEAFNIALRIQPQILTFLSLVTWGQCMYYGNQWPKRKAVGLALPLGLLMGGVEAGLIRALWRAKDRGIGWPVTFMAVLAAFLLCAGVARHYWDIYKMRTVRGISFLFVGIDAMGDLTSLVSVFFQEELDILGMVIYGSELALWLGVFTCGGWYNLRPWLRKMIQKHRKVQDEVECVENAPGVVEGTSTAVNGVAVRRRRSSASSSTVFRTASATADDRRENNDPR
jgi:PQ loop repeat